MKKILSFMVLLAILAILYQYGIIFLKKGHEINYDLVFENKKFKVEEIYDKDSEGYYTITISNDDYHFIYEIKDEFNKQQKIVKEIEMVEANNVMCIYPIYIKDKALSNITCSQKTNKTIYSYTYYKNDNLVKQLVEKLKGKNITNLAWEAENKELTKDGTISSYQKNIMENDTIAVWAYKRLYVADRDKTHYIDIFEDDIYENKAATLIGYNYYIPKYDEDNFKNFNRYYKINIKRREKSELLLQDTLSKETYVNGVVDGKMYIFDKKNLIQYEINDDNDSPRKTGDQNLNAQYYDGKWHDKSIIEFKDKEIKFKKDYTAIEELKQYKYDEIYETDRYYYLKNNGEISRIYKKNLNQKVILFTANNLKSIVANKDTIYFIIDDTIYYYHDNYGIRRIIVSNEFKYNYNNIYAVYKAS